MSYKYLYDRLIGFKISNPSEKHYSIVSNFVKTNRWQPNVDPTDFVQVLWIFFLIAIFSCAGTPDVNESHYLTKAKHFWNPDWCQGDLFLQSANSHFIFYTLFGWLTLWFSLDLVAWMGRIFSWMLLAFSFQRICHSLSVKNWIGISVFVLLFIYLSGNFDLAGEWVLGGFEAKPISYAFVVLSLNYLLQREPQKCLVLAGAAICIHPVIGVWSAICLATTELMHRLQTKPPANLRIDSSVSVRKLHIALCLAVVLSALGCLPAIYSAAPTDPDIQKIANQIQVHHRLSHHLLFESFPAGQVFKFVIQIIFFFVLNRLSSKNIRLFVFSLTGLAFSFIGIFLNSVATGDGMAADFANSLLKFYWFRFADFTIPLFISLTCGQLLPPLVKSDFKGKKIIGSISFGVLILAGVVSLLVKFTQQRPPADQAMLPSYVAIDRTNATFRNWKACCHWIHNNTDANAIFATPSSQQTFKWYSNRAELVNWKDCPQDADGIIEWDRRIRMTSAIEKQITGGFLGLSDLQLQQLAVEFGVNHLVCHQSFEDALPRRISNSDALERIYPTSSDKKTTYVVYRFKLNKLSRSAAINK